MKFVSMNRLRARLSVIYYVKARTLGGDNYVTAWYSLMSNAGFYDLREYARKVNG